MVKCSKLSHLWHWTSQAYSTTHYSDWQRHCGRAHDTVLHLWVLSVWLPRSVRRQTRSILRRHSGIRSHIGGHPQVLYVSQRAGWQVKVFTPWPVAACCWVSLCFLSGAERRLSGRMYMWAKEKTSLSTLRSNLSPILILFLYCFEGINVAQTKRNKLSCMPLL